MKIWSVCFAYLLCFSASMAQGEGRRAIEMAECGFLGSVAADQMSDLQERPAALDGVIADVIDFTNLYYHFSGRVASQDDQSISFEMYQTVRRVGGAHFQRRAGSMSSQNTVLLANRLLSRCRDALRQLQG